MKGRFFKWAAAALLLVFAFLLGGCTEQDDAAAREIMLALGIDPGPEASPSPLPTPNIETPTGGFVEVKKGGATLRETPGRDGSIAAKVKKGAVLERVSETRADGEDWYGVLHEGRTLYVRASRVRSARETEKLLGRGTPIRRAG